jgi:hypothetical protein
MSTASMVGRIALLAAVRSPTPAPWSLDDPITEARSRKSGTMPQVIPGTDPPIVDGALASPAILGDTLADMSAAREMHQERPADLAPGKPPFMSARYLYACWWGLFAVQVLVNLLD